MKHIYITSSLLFFIGTLFAQPTLNQANHAYTIGESFTSTTVSWDGTLPTTGAGLTWDYSTLTTTGTATIDAIDPSLGLGTTDFSGANICANSDGGNAYAYSNVSSTQFENYGYHIPSIPLSQFYNNSEVQMVYPFSYGDSNSDYFASTFVNGVTWYRSGTTTIEAVGYGTITLPTATVTDVIQIKMIQDYKDSSSALTYNYLTEIYIWLKPGYHNTIFSLTQLDLDGSLSYSSTYDANPVLNVKSLTAESLSIYPNPAHDVLTLDWQSNLQVKQIIMTDATGKIVFQSSKLESNIDIENLPTGIYYLEMWAAEDRVIKKFVKI